MIIYWKIFAALLILKALAAADGEPVTTAPIDGTGGTSEAEWSPPPHVINEGATAIPEAEWTPPPNNADGATGTPGPEWIPPTIGGPGGTPEAEWSPPPNNADGATGTPGPEWTPPMHLNKTGTPHKYNYTASYTKPTTKPQFLNATKPSGHSNTTAILYTQNYTDSYMNSTGPLFTNFTTPPDGSAIARANSFVLSNKRAIAANVPDFYYYSYDGNGYYISDGGNDMYDGGNQVSFQSGETTPTQIRYGQYYRAEDNYEVSSSTGHPFITLVYVNNTFSTYDFYSLKVASNAGADGGGTVAYYNSSASVYGIYVTIYVEHVYGTEDPSICQVYFAASQSGPPKTYPIRETSDSDSLASGIKIYNSPKDAWIGYMLLSSRDGRYMSQYHVFTATKRLIGLLYGRIESPPFNFPYAPIEYLHSNVSTTAIPTPHTTAYNTSRNASIPEIPVHSQLRQPINRIVDRISEIRNTIYDFYYYNYDGSTYIGDGGNDMYDNGNMVFINTNGGGPQIVYDQYYLKEYEYEFVSYKGWPFIALMYVNNTNYAKNSFSIRVTGDAGADGRGNKVYFNSSASMDGIEVKYTVTQVYGTSDPTICEVFFACSKSGNESLSHFEPRRTSPSTNDLDSGVSVGNYPRDIWIGYMLLSRSQGRFISQYEVNQAVTTIVSALFNYNYIPFNFAITPTVIPQTTTAYYFRYAYEGFQYRVCNNQKYYAQNTTQCGGIRTPTLVKVTVEFPSLLGYNNTAVGAFSSCSNDSNTCYSGCNNTKELVGDLKVLDCQTTCCSYSYCNSFYSYHYDYNYFRNYGNYTPPNITLPESQLPDAQVEVLPNCVFKTFAPQLKTCVDQIFDAWPFDSPGQCKNKIMSSFHCTLKKIGQCKTSELFSSAMIQLPSNTNLNISLIYLQQTNILDLLCSVPTRDLFNASFHFWDTGPYSYNFSFGLNQLPAPIHFGNPYCDRFILDSLLDWGMEYLLVLKSSTSRNEMCSSLKGLINKVLDAVNSRCNLEMIASHFPCDSVLRNQIRALIVQAKAMIPKIAPDYCEGVEPPTEPEHPDDIPFLPSCTLRQTIKAVWSCESIFTKETPYSDSNMCKSNVNRVLHCVANRLQECAKGDGVNVFDTLSPYTRFEDIIQGIRFLATPRRNDGFYYGNYGNYGYHGARPSPNFNDMICSGGPISASSIEYYMRNFVGICRPNSTYGIAKKIVQAYYNFLGARNAADVCMAFRSARDTIVDVFQNQCDITFIKYFLPVTSPLRRAFDIGVNIILKVLPTLEISVCPKALPPSGNETSTATKWLKMYAKWRSYTLPKWQAGFDKWRSETGQGETIELPKCLDFTGIRCRNPAMMTCESDYFGCGFCSCLDHKYLGLTSQFMQPYIQDYEIWEDFQSQWDDGYTDWEDNNY
ncbi:uncharacterized protein LOC120335290 isoform X3 [Styela clava]